MPSFHRLMMCLAAIGLLETAQAQDAKNLAAPSKLEQFNTPADIQQGLQNMRAFCSRCHGRDGRGAKGPDLTDGVWRHAKTDEDLIRIIANGITGTGMNGFGAAYEDSYWPIIAYIRDQEKKRVKEQGPLTGKPDRGYQLFKQNKCASCHWTGSEGGRRGTDLSRLTATPEYVRQSMTDPNSQIDSDYQKLHLTLDDGRQVTGRRLYENSHYLLIMDDQENLHAIPKSRIENLNRPHESLMPSFAKELSPEDIEDLTAYLYSLQKEPAK